LSGDGFEAGGVHDWVGGFWSVWKRLWRKAMLSLWT
jgi:hypothetical protein